MTERLAGSWLLVRYCSGYESKQRPGQLSALLGGPGLEPLTDGERALCKEPLDQVASLQAHVDRDVIVATTGGTMGPGIRNVFDDKNGVRRRQFVVFRDEGMLSVRCEVCEARQVLSDTIRNVAEKDPSKVCHALKAHCGYYAGSRASSDSERHIRNLQLMLPDTAGRVGFGLVGNAKDTGNYRGNKGGRLEKRLGWGRGAAGPGRPPSSSRGRSGRLWADGRTRWRGPWCPRRTSGRRPVAARSWSKYRYAAPRRGSYRDLEKPQPVRHAGAFG